MQLWKNNQAPEFCYYSQGPKFGYLVFIPISALILFYFLKI